MCLLSSCFCLRCRSQATTARGKTIIKGFPVLHELIRCVYLRVVFLSFLLIRHGGCKGYNSNRNLGRSFFLLLLWWWWCLCIHVCVRTVDDRLSLFFFPVSPASLYTWVFPVLSAAFYKECRFLFSFAVLDTRVRTCVQRSKEKNGDADFFFFFRYS